MIAWISALLFLLGFLFYVRVNLWMGSLLIGAFLLTLSLYSPAGLASLVGLWTVFILFALPLNLIPLRRALISKAVLRLFRAEIPAMSSTEREALEAGTVWWDADLFSGRPRWSRLLDTRLSKLSKREQDFLDGPVEELCRMVNDWEITHHRHGLPPEVWAFIKQSGLFGMIIPKRYGGLEFSALGHSAVVTKIASRGITAAVTVMVPNSLGPAELLLRYGTDAQKDHYLPKLASGEEVPCFALTAPNAGSDAGAMTDSGVLCRGQFDGEEILGIRLNWDKRYITLGPVATLLGLAFKLYDPDHLLGEKEELGITLALISTDTPGVEIGRRHLPLNVPFQNGPNSGKDVFIPLDWVIGGTERCGQGWRMLMDCLAAGRSISLPALATGTGKLASRATGAYARIRRQFHLPIGKFEGVQEPLARIAAYTYMLDAARVLTASAVDLGEKPSVVSAIVKYHHTEFMRHLVNDAMDVQGGSGICLGPRNLIGRVYQAVPISITVEGANILTRSLIIYGQGAIRCHPFLYPAIQAAQCEDAERALRDFDRALFGHVGFFISNLLRAVVLGASGSRLTGAPISGPTAHYYRQLTRISAAFTFLSDVAMLLLGGALKRKEKISGRFADTLSYMYLASATLKRFEDDGRPDGDLPLVHWICRDLMHRAQMSLDGILKNFPLRPIAGLLRLLVFPLGRHLHAPTDRLGGEIAGLLLQPGEVRDRLTAGMFIPQIQPPFQPDGEHDTLAEIEIALEKVIAAEDIERKLEHAIRDGKLSGINPAGDQEQQLLLLAREAEILDDTEVEALRQAWRARAAVIKVDDFPSDFGLRSSDHGEST